MNTEIAKTNGNGQLALAVEAALIDGDLSKLGVNDRVAYYNKTCESVGLNPLTQPFNYIVLKGKLRLYAKKDCTEQLRSNKNVSIKILSRVKDGDIYVVTAAARLPNGREDENIGALSIKGLVGEELANAYMKAETKAKRRVTLSICGLGWLDDSETESIRGAQFVAPDWNPENLTGRERDLHLLNQPEAPLPKPEFQTTVKPLENPWLYQLTRAGKAKYLFQIYMDKPEWFRNIDARYGNKQMTEEEYVNCRAAIDHEDSIYLRQCAMEEVDAGKGETENEQ